MKTRKKVLWCILALILIAGIVCAGLFIHNENKIKNYSTYCMDSVRQELGEYLENVSMPNATKLDGAYIYTGSVRYEGVDYSFTCKVYSKENVDLELEPINQADMDKAEEAQTYTIMGPENGFDEQLEAGQLVLRGEYEDHTDIIFIDQEMWQNYIDPHKMIYGDQVSFKGEVEQIDGAAGTHYYKAVSINTLEELFLTSTLEGENSLVIVFSPTGHTKQIATYISEIIDCELNEIGPENPYTEEDLNWRNEESRSYKEYQDLSIRPEFVNDFNLDQYDTIYLGFPIWFGRTPNIIFTLLEKYDFSDKNIVLFCTSGSSGIEGSFEYLEPYNLNIIGSKRFAQGATKEEVQQWLESL